MGDVHLVWNLFLALAMRALKAQLMTVNRGHWVAVAANLYKT